MVSRSELKKIKDLQLRIITNLATKRYFVQRSIASLQSLEKKLNLRFNVIDYPISFRNIPKLEIQSYIDKSIDKKNDFSMVDLKMMIGSCSNYLNNVASTPLFMIDTLREFLGLRNINFREIDLYIQRISNEEKTNYNNMKGSIMKIETKRDINIENRVELKDKFVFKGIDRRLIFNKYKYTLFCSLGQSKWYCEKSAENIIDFIKSLRIEERTKKDEWLR